MSQRSGTRRGEASASSTSRVRSSAATRSSSTDPEVAHPACPSAAELWFRQNFALLDRPDLGHHYSALLDAWCRLEALNNFAVGKGCKLRLAAPKPGLLNHWIQAGRAARSKKSPRVSDIDAFARETWAWWSAMQPEWRTVDPNARSDPSRDVTGEGWGAALDVRGQNGMLSVVACACWWGIALEGGTLERCRSWLRFMNDVTWVINQMIANV
ncbi:hypothetical protein EV715DRAFT_214934 [Schizophyllum commune]